MMLIGKSCVSCFELCIFFLSSLCWLEGLICCEGTEKDLWDILRKTWTGEQGSAKNYNEGAMIHYHFVRSHSEENLGDFYCWVWGKGMMLRIYFILFICMICGLIQTCRIRVQMQYCIENNCINMETYRWRKIRMVTIEELWQKWQGNIST